MFPLDPQFRGRRVVTVHNQRDFLFVRHHRYIFEDTNDVHHNRKSDSTLEGQGAAKAEVRRTPARPKSGHRGIKEMRCRWSGQGCIISSVG